MNFWHSVHGAALSVELLALSILVVSTHAVTCIWWPTRTTWTHEESACSLWFLLWSHAGIAHVSLVVRAHRRSRDFLGANVVGVVALGRHVASRDTDATRCLTMHVVLLLLLLYLVLREEDARGDLFFAARVLHLFELIIRYLWAKVTLVARLVNRYLWYVSMRYHSWPLLISDARVAANRSWPLWSLRRVSRRWEHLVGYVHVREWWWRL